MATDPAKITEELPAILQHIEQPSRFAVGGSLRFFHPQIEVQGVGRVALPLLPQQAEALIAIAEPAPYGRGEETLVNREVRRTWQLDSQRVELRGEGWEESLREIVAAVGEGLGIAEKIEAQFYKLLLYAPGDFFVEHRDTEKVAGMFATLVVVLPGDYSGGRLRVRHQAREESFELHGDAPDRVAYAAFFADCLHQVEAITAGHRLTLLYNLVRKGSGKLPQLQEYRAEREQASDLLRDWSEALRRGTRELPLKVIYPLEHAYTPAELSFTALKGADHALAEILLDAAQAAECEIHLALLTQKESGEAEYHGDYYHRRGRRGRYRGDYESYPEQEDFEVGEVYECEQLLDQWCSPDGHHPVLGKLPFQGAQVCPPDLFEHLEPSQLSFSEATGNEGASFERSYHLASLVIWPRHQRVQAVIDAGGAAAIAYLAHLVAQHAAGAADTAHYREETSALLNYIFNRFFPSATDAMAEYTMRKIRFRYGEELRISLLLLTLERLQVVEQYAERIPALLDSMIFDQSEYDALATWLAKEQAVVLREPILDKLLQVESLYQVKKSATLLRAVVERFDASAVQALSGNAERLLEQLDQGMAKERSIYSQNDVFTEAVILDLLNGLERIALALAERFIEQLFQWLNALEVEQLLIPTAFTLQQRSLRSEGEERLVQRLIDDLQRRLQEPCEPPSDWRRSNQLAIQIAVSDPCYLKLLDFLNSPVEREWHYKGLQKERKKLEAIIRASRCDLDCTTLKKGSPHTLVCTKNENSYRRQCAQRERDAQNLEKLLQGRG